MREDGVLPEEETLFGELVVSQGLASRAQVDECLDLLRKMRASGVDAPPKLGELLRDRGYLSKTADLTLRPASVARKAPTDGIELPPEAADPSNHFGKYVRTRRLGAGGMGEVWRAFDTELGRWVALKFLNSHDPEELARFKREAHTAAKLNHPNIGAVYDVGEHANRHFIAMHLIDGVTLAAFPREDRRALVEILRDVARAVHYAHEQGIIHRDLKPQNVMVESNPRRAYVMDFGLARQLRQSGASLTVSGMMIGTPSYMAPEQARGESRAVDARTDVYGLGATLYHVLVGRPPFEDPNLYDLVVRVVTEEPVTPRRLDRKIDEDLEKVVLKALDKDPSRRYPTARELAEDLTRWLEGDPVEARRPSTLRRLVRTMRRHKGAWIVGGVALAFVLTGAVALAMQAIRHREEAGRREQLAARRVAGLRHLATLWQTILQRKQDLRGLRATPEVLRRDLMSAVEAVDAYVRAWPDEPQGYYVRARALAYLGDRAAAEREVREAIGKVREFRPGWTLLGMLKLEEYEETVSLGLDAGSLEEEARAAFGRGWIATTAEADAERWGLAWSREDQVLAALARIQASPREAQAHMLREAFDQYRAEEFACWLGTTSGDPAEQVALQSRALELAPGYALARFQRGSAKMKLGDAAGAEADLTVAIEVRPDFAAAHANRALARDALGKHADAISDHDRAIDLRPGQARLHCNRGRTEHLRGRHDTAMADFDRALALNRGYAPAYVARGLALYALGRFDEAVVDFTEATNLEPQRPDGWINRGVAHEARGDPSAALADYGRALELRPDFVEALYGRGNVRLKLNDAAGAIEDFGRTIELRPSFAEAWANRGNARAYHARSLEGDEARAVLKLAEADLQRALELAPLQWPARATVQGWLAEVRRLLQH